MKNASISQHTQGFRSLKNGLIVLFLGWLMTGMINEVKAQTVLTIGNKTDCEMYIYVTNCNSSNFTFYLPAKSQNNFTLPDQPKLIKVDFPGGLTPDITAYFPSCSISSDSSSPNSCYSDFETAVNGLGNFWFGVW